MEHTSHDSQEVIEFDQRLNSIIEATSMCNDFRAVLKRYKKESIASTYSSRLAEYDLARTHSCQLVKRKCNTLLNNVAGKHDVVTVGMVCAKKKKRDDDEVLKAQKAVETAEARLGKEQLKSEREHLNHGKSYFVISRR